MPGSAHAHADQGYVLNMYHFNIQYVCGHEKSMQRIIKQSFEPLVDFYLEHPDWGADFEMQGLMIEYMGENYPEVLDKFRRIVNSGQVALVSFHFSDQLVLGFPAHDQEWSLMINDSIMLKHGIKRSETVFLQEAQFGEGVCDMARRQGYKVAVITQGHYAWFQDPHPVPYYTCRGLEVLEGRDAALPSGLKVEWNFLGDGELVATGGFSPYFPGLFREKPGRLKALERKFKDYEARGFKIAKVSDYVQALHDTGETPSELQPIADCPWRPEDGSCVFQWMGKYSSSWEQDYTLRTNNWDTRAYLIAAEQQGTDQATLEQAWRHQLHSEVTDITGWYPLPVEIRYGREHDSLAREALKAYTPEAAQGVGFEPVLEPIKSPTLKVWIDGPVKDPSLEWYKVEGQDNMLALQASWKKSKGLVAVVFPLEGHALEYSPALLESEVRTIGFDQIKHNTFHLALTNGLIGLGKGYYLVRDNRKGMLAAKVDVDAGQIRFEIKNGSEDRINMQFYIIKGTANEALEWANKINFTKPR